MKRLRALDLYCGGGCSAIGLHQAGFDEIVGVDINDHPNYPFDFVQADVLNAPVDVRTFDFIWASPPCQRFSQAVSNKNKQGKHVDLISETREILKGHPYTCIENVRQAPIRPDVVLTGPSVGLPFLLRRRHFELSFFMMYPPPATGLDKWKWKSGKALSITKSMAMKDHYYPRKALGLSGVPSLEHVKEVMGIPQEYELTYEEMGEGVPPAYAKFIADEVVRLIRGK